MLIKPKEILIPKKKDLTRWAVIACDQFTSDFDYWQKTKEYIGKSVSSLNLILPEIYLNDKPESRIEKINENMRRYLNNNVFKSLGECFVLTARKTAYGNLRLGIVLAVDLEEYSYEKGNRALIRATEGTILERLPPRIKIRENAPLELPHIMLLIDDVKNEIIKPLYEKRKSLEKVYGFKLCMGGGSVEGYKITDTKGVTESFLRLLNKDTLIKKYGKDEKFLFAAGDGNHSLASAKAVWNNFKRGLSAKEAENHPLRYALCEVVSLYDEGLKFEPIHRFIKGVDAERFAQGEFPSSRGAAAAAGWLYENDALPGRGLLKGKLIYNGKKTDIGFPSDISLAVSGTDEYIKNYINGSGGEVDYIHGEKDLEKLVKGNANSVGIVMPSMEKGQLFKTVIESGALPRKCFSMGEAEEKRYYLEASKIM